MGPVPYKIIDRLHDEVKTNIKLNQQVISLIQSFVKYLKEPRYQSPLTINELSDLFKRFYQDLNVLIICVYTQSNSTKKQLISECDYFNENPKIFDYLLAIANYSNSSIRLLKRSDNDALYQLRVFNFYKFLIILESINLAEHELFRSGDDVTLYDEIFKFDQRDIIYEEFLKEKLDTLKELNIPFERKLDLSDEEIEILQKNIDELDECKTPFTKLKSVVNLQKKLIGFLSNKYNESINNDILLPSLIYLLIYKLNHKNLYLNFLFIKHFLNIIDTNPDLYQLNLYLSYNPYSERPPLKCKKTSLLGYLNLHDSQFLAQEHKIDDEFDFFTNDKDLITFINSNYLNFGELNYYLTNFEAIIVYLSNTTISELAPNIEINKNIIKFPIDKLVDEELLSHFQFPDGQIAEEINRSRSSSILNQISNKISETRSRSSSMKKENFPTVDEGWKIRNIFKINQDDTEDDNSIFSPTKRSNSLMTKLSPSHSRTRSSSIENKRNSITQKFSNGVSEFMTKLNQSDVNPSNSSLQSIEQEASGRQRTTSLQILDKWFNNLSVSKKPEVVNEEVDLHELTKYHNMDFENLTIKDLKILKGYYDQLCINVLKDDLNAESIDSDKLHENIITSSSSL
ncbi:unnamed protein product [Candida verbasci]|uniref:VPS9 domain-containing protein n=1 Tax=Candida verbasci TaxID=1227364 RepID=A0A9W4TR79_9ASCO|nr:unnamed protein product [Candida verbasci]